ncbi:MAG: hypothetical protein ACE5EK_03585 [Nitrospinales bacterium]
MLRTLIFIFALLFIFSISTAYAQYQCTEGDCENGTGKKVVTDSTAYMEGQFTDGVLTQGKVVFPNGDVFEGRFEGQQLVQGSKKFKAGGSLEGKFKSGVLHEGKITYRDGSSRWIKLKMQ